jgi:hypothetical protein
MRECVKTEVEPEFGLERFGRCRLKGLLKWKTKLSNMSLSSYAKVRGLVCEGWSRAAPGHCDPFVPPRPVLSAASGLPIMP